jgi:hypothetical protein
MTLLRLAIPGIVLISAIAATASDPDAFWRGALAAVDQTEPAVRETSPGQLVFPGPDGAIWHATKAASVATCSMAVIHLQDSTGASPPRAVQTSDQAAAPTSAVWPRRRLSPLAIPSCTSTCPGRRRPAAL